MFWLDPDTLLVARIRIICFQLVKSKFQYLLTRFLTSSRFSWVGVLIKISSIWSLMIANHLFVTIEMFIHSFLSKLEKILVIISLGSGRSAICLRSSILLQSNSATNLVPNLSGFRLTRSLFFAEIFLFLNLATYLIIALWFDGKIHAAITLLPYLVCMIQGTHYDLKELGLGFYVIFPYR